VLVHQGRNVLRLPLETRRELLADALATVDYPVLRSTPFDAKPADLIRAAKELELEGIIAKRRLLLRAGAAERSVAQIQDQPLAGVRHRRLQE